MKYLDGFKDRLLSDARHTKREYNYAAENNSGSEEDIGLFFNTATPHLRIRLPRAKPSEAHATEVLPG